MLNSARTKSAAKAPTRASRFGCKQIALDWLFRELRNIRKMIRQRVGIIDTEIARRAAGLLAMNADIGQDHRHAKRLRLLHRGAPAFEARRIDQGRSSAQQSVHVRQRNHSKIAKIRPEAARFDLPHQIVEIVRLAGVVRTARGRDDDVDTALFENAQRIDHGLMVLVPPELVRQIKIFRRQAVLRDDIGRKYSQSGGRAGCVANRTTEMSLVERG